MRWFIVCSIAALVGLSSLVFAGGKSGSVDHGGTSRAVIKQSPTVVGDMVRKMYLALEHRSRDMKGYTPRDGLVLPDILPDDVRAEDAEEIYQLLAVDMWYEHPLNLPKRVSHVVLHVAWMKTTMKIHVKVQPLGGDDWDKGCVVEVEFDPGREHAWWGRGSDFADEKLREIRRMVDSASE